MSAGVAIPVTADAPSREDLVRVSVWEIPVRVTHWLIAVSIVTLSISGFYIGWPFVAVSGPAGESALMAWMKFIHGVSAYTFTGALLVRIIWMCTGNKEDTKL